MTRRQDLIDLIQSLSAEEGTRQPTAADWLKGQDERRVARNATRNPTEKESDPVPWQLN